MKNLTQFECPLCHLLQKPVSKYTIVLIEINLTFYMCKIKIAQSRINWTISRERKQQSKDPEEGERKEWNLSWTRLSPIHHLESLKVRRCGVRQSESEEVASYEEGWIEYI